MEDPLMLEYLQECREHLADIESDLLAIEDAGDKAEDALLNKVFRAAHSIKGGAGFFDLEDIQKLGHRVENILDMLRSREISPSPETINLLLLSFDRLRTLIAQPRAAIEIEDLVQALTTLGTTHLPAKDKKSLDQKVPLQLSNGKACRVKLTEFDALQAKKRGKTIHILDMDLLHDVHRHGKTPWSLMKELGSCGNVLDCVWGIEEVGTLDDAPAATIPLQVLFASVLDAELLGTMLNLAPEHIIPVPLSEPAPVPLAKPVPPPAPKAEPSPEAVEPMPPQVAPIPAQTTPQTMAPTAASAPTPASSATSNAPEQETTLRVHISLLEKLMNLAGEMVLGRNQLMDAIQRQDMRAISTGGQRINQVTSELQETIMLTRLQPIGNILNRYPRVVRDLAKELGKEIQITINGKDVEIDRSILEGLSDPLTHMVRNAVDHGIELPQERERQGKSAAGHIDLNVFHEAGQVVVELKDDGKGLDITRIAAKAQDKGLVTAEQVRAMSDKEKAGLIFLPGLSTADKVSNLSGRGVGMDVVKTNIERLGGITDIESAPGLGTCFRIKLPLTLAIVPSLLVSSGEERFAIPQVNVSELIRIAPEEVHKRIERIGETEVLLLRGELIPLIRLSEVLGSTFVYRDPETGEPLHDRRKRLADRRSRASEGQDRTGAGRRSSDGSFLNIAVLNAGSAQYGLVVEAFHDTVEIVVKPLGRHLKALRELAGATILGDGSLALILDVVGIADAWNMKAQAERVRKAERELEGLDTTQDRHAFLLFDNAPGETCAVPLEQVARVEKVERNQIETLGGRRTMQYRGGHLSLVQLQDRAQVRPIEEDQELVVIVFESRGKEVGLLAALPVDSIEVDIAVDQVTHRQPGIAGSAILRKRTTLIVDIHELLGIDQAEAPRAEGITLLLAEDSAFFRSQVKRFLESDGYQVIAAEDGEDAWAKLQAKASEIKAVVSDIEMPRMNGFELVQRIRQVPAFADLPVIALTSLAGEEDVEHGKAMGFTEYQIKLDKERLLDGLHRALGNHKNRESF